jgi:uncharacterized protein
MLLDTSGLLCAHHVGETVHATARGLIAATPRLVTHNYVLAEFVALAEARRLSRLPALAFLTQLVRIPKVEVVWVTEDIHEGAMDLLERRPDKTYSLCDAVSFVLMRQRGIIEALTTDRHFEQEGFRRLLG